MADRFALISDIHSNIEALDAVMEDIDRHGIQRTICLGDIVGYGPNPAECLRIAIEKFEFSILGNHEEAALFVPAWFNPRAKRAVEWTRDMINEGMSSSDGADLWNFLGDLKPKALVGDILFVHGSPREPTTEYIRAMDTRYDREKIDEIFGMVPRLCFVGHSHLPGVFTPNYRFLKPAQIGGAVRLGQDKAVINVGSVGQPRDGDTRACWVSVEGNIVRWHRVEYDYETTADKILSVDGLPDANADRLLEGR